MLSNFTSILLCFFLFIYTSVEVYANDESTMFTTYMLEWREKSQIAEDYLREAESQLKSGYRSRACAKQRLASKYGLEAFSALVLAQRYTDSERKIDNIEDTLARWKKLSNCSTANSLFN